MEHKNTLNKPSWIKIKFPTEVNRINHIKNILHKRNLKSVCEEALCPNLLECFNNGVATFMILGSKCTRKCAFCNVKHGRPSNINKNEPKNLAKAVFHMNLKHVVITSVNRDDLKDGGAQHFVECIKEIRFMNSNIKIEILVPDFRGCMDFAIDVISKTPPDIFNHNIESVPRLYKYVRPGANYNLSLELLKKFKINNPDLPTKSGIMLGLGETNEEIIDVIKDLKNHKVNMLTIGQYLQPSYNHLPVKRYVKIKEFNYIKQKALKFGFTYVASGPFIRSSYNADLQARGIDFNKIN